jgi:hypothetical protein
MSLQNCSPACNPPSTTNIPGAAGEDGAAGADGAPGVNAYTLNTAAFVVPAKAANVTVTVADTSWMAVGQPIFIEGAGVFEVVAIPSATTVQLEYLDYDTNVEVGTNIAIGSVVTPGGFQEPAPAVPAMTTATVYATGTAYTLTNSAGLITFGTTSPSLTIPAAGTWLILGQVQLEYVGATFAASRTVTPKIRRTNNTPTDVVTGSFRTDIITTLTYTAGVVPLAPQVYVTANTDDILQLWASIDVVPSAGSMQVSQASIVAVKLVT